MRNVAGKWRDSASLIVLGKQKTESLVSDKPSNCNYDVLVQTRTRSASYPNSVVFPGGVHEAADASGDWLKLLKCFGYSDQEFNTLFQKARPVTPLFQKNPVLRNVALRITAIRETFEEVGLLICSREHIQNKNNTWASICTDVDVHYWQHRVSKDPLEFINLCKEYNCYPDLWSLHQWSNWLTPTGKPHRFDTAFFITAIEDKPKYLKSSNEVVKLEWSTPQELFDQNRQGKIELYPPQCYELNFLTHLKNAQDLKSFTEHRLDQCDELMYPIAFKAKDGILHVLPGDDLYHSNVNYNDQLITINKTILELREESNILHRFEERNNERLFISRNKKNLVLGNAMIKFHIDKV